MRTTGLRLACTRNRYAGFRPGHMNALEEACVNMFHIYTNRLDECVPCYNKVLPRILHIVLLLTGSITPHTEALPTHPSPVGYRTSA